MVNETHNLAMSKNSYTTSGDVVDRLEVEGENEYYISFLLVNS